VNILCGFAPCERVCSYWTFHPPTALFFSNRRSWPLTKQISLKLRAQDVSSSKRDRQTVLKQNCTAQYFIVVSLDLRRKKKYENGDLQVTSSTDGQHGGQEKATTGACARSGPLVWISHCCGQLIVLMGTSRPRSFTR